MYKSALEINTNKIKNLDKSLEIAIRDDAFNHNEVDETLRKHFENSCIRVEDYPYHKLVFERWLSEAKDEAKEWSTNEKYLIKQRYKYIFPMNIFIINVSNTWTYN